MIATLGSYEHLFGPCHMQTLSLAARVAEELSGAGETRVACRLMERVVRDLGRAAGRTHEKRVSALGKLRDLRLGEGDVPGAIAAQTEIAECRALTAGPEAAETIRARSEAETLLLRAESTAAS
jgi:hypothetical protein